MKRTRIVARPYQRRAVDEITKRLAAVGARVLAVGPTGCGKTVVASLVIKRYLKRHPRRRVLFVAHRYELIDQTHKTLEKLGVHAGILMAQEESLVSTDRESRADADAPVQVASVQTLDRRGIPKDVGLIVFDEAHRAAAKSYRDIEDKAPRARVLGLTATPVRADGLGLADRFDEPIVTIATLAELYDGRYLKRPTTYVGVDAEVAELAAKGKRANALGDVLIESRTMKKLMGGIVSEAMRLAPGVPKLLFAGSVNHAEDIAHRFRVAGILAEVITGDTPVHEREDLLERFAIGEIEVLCNVNVFGEGFDHPAIGAVIVAVITRSLARWLQICGRALHADEHDPIILDHGNNAIRLNCDPAEDRKWSIEDGDENDEDGNPPRKACVKCRMLIFAGLRTCPQCLAAQPLTERDRMAEDERVRLVELAQWNAARKMRLEGYARERGLPLSWVEGAMLA